MKKRTVLISVLSAALFLSACVVNNREDSIVIDITNASGFDIYGISVSAAAHTQSAVYADGSTIQKGDSMSVEFRQPEDFVLEGEEEFEISVFDNDEEPVPIETVTLELKPGKVYYLEISGESLEEAEVQYKE